MSTIPVKIIELQSFETAMPDEPAAQYQLTYQVAGLRRVQLRGKEMILQPGEMLLTVPQAECFTLGPKSGDQRFYRLRFSREAMDLLMSGSVETDLPGLFRRNAPFRLEADGAIAMDGILRSMQRELEQTLTDQLLSLKLQLGLLLLTLARKIAPEQPRDDSRMNHSRRGLPEQVAAFIDEHYTEAVTLDAVARFFQISPSALSRSFKRRMGVPPIAYLNRTRVNAACALIADTDISLAEVSRKVGYDSQTYFGRVFKDLTGLTPSLYRKHQRLKHSFSD